MRKKDGCLLLCKDKNFKANHNEYLNANYADIDVCYYAKIRILKQITTTSNLDISEVVMFVTMQR